jgi:hypothetical protein
MAVVDLATAKSYLNITGSASDDTLQSIVYAAQAAIAEKCGPLEPVQRTVRIPGSGSSTLVLPAPVGSIISMADAAGSPVDVSDFFLDQAAGLINAGDFTFSSRWYDVTFNHGRVTCPPDLILAVKELIRHLWESQRGGTRRPGSTVRRANE